MTGPTPRNIRVGLVDDHAVVRDGTAALLGREADIEVVGTAADLGGADDLLRLEPDVLVVDIRLGSENGLALLRRITEAGGPAVVLLTAFDYPQFVDAALRMGASGYVLKTDPIDVDLETQTVTTPFQDRFTFEVDPFRKHCLLNGLDEVGLTLADEAAIATHESRVRADLPFLAEASRQAA